MRIAKVARVIPDGSPLPVIALERDGALYDVGALAKLAFSAEELAEIDRYATEGGINLWEKPSTDQPIR